MNYGFLLAAFKKLSEPDAAMRFLKKSTREHPMVSLVLLDWSVRESFHILHYLEKQNIDRNRFEVVVIEYFSRESEAVKLFKDQVDTWVLLGMPETCIYHKHLMYNCGIALSRGEIVITCDSDSMVKEEFVQTIIREFEHQDRIVLHLDQFRNTRRDFYPFNYPSFADVLGPGCINNAGGRTKGLNDLEDPLHKKNYGACMCARRKDLIAIGGSDEHLDYLGHVCGPYEMTFRLINAGLREVWHESEFLYHTWHPGQDGVDNFKGPDDGQQMSSTALESLITKRVMPLVENKGIQLLRSRLKLSEEDIQANLVDANYEVALARSNLSAENSARSMALENDLTDLHRGYRITKEDESFYARPLIDPHIYGETRGECNLALKSTSWLGILAEIDRNYPMVLRLCEMVNALYYGLFMRVYWVLSAPVKGLWKLVALWNWGKGKKRFSSGMQDANENQRTFSSMRDMIRKYNNNWLAARRSYAYMRRCTNILVANLYYISHLTDHDGRWKRPVLLTKSRYIQVYLVTLMKLKLLPVLQVISLRDISQVQSCFQSLDSKEEPIGIIVARDLFTSYYGTLNSFVRSADALII